MLRPFGWNRLDKAQFGRSDARLVEMTVPAPAQSQESSRVANPATLQSMNSRAKTPMAMAPRVDQTVALIPTNSPGPAFGGRGGSPARRRAGPDPRDLQEFAGDRMRRGDIEGRIVMRIGDRA